MSTVNKQRGLIILTEKDKQQLISYSIIVITLLLGFGILCNKVYAVTSYNVTTYATVTAGDIKMNNVLYGNRLTSNTLDNDTENIQTLDIPPPLMKSPLIKDNTLDNLDLIGFKIRDYDLKSLDEFNKMLNKPVEQQTEPKVKTNPLNLSKTSFDCLVLNAYHEARGEGYKGIAAVTEVVLNRSRERSKGVCTIIYEPYQFSWTINGKRKRVDSKQYEIVKNHVTKHIEHLENGGKQITNGATYFHARHINPSWSRNSSLKCTSKVGKHLFYREFKRK